MKSLALYSLVFTFVLLGMALLVEVVVVFATRVARLLLVDGGRDDKISPHVVHNVG